MPGTGTDGWWKAPDSSWRVDAYQRHMAGIQPNWDGLAKLERAVARLQSLYDDGWPPPVECSGCPHLDGF